MRPIRAAVGKRKSLAVACSGALAALGPPAFAQEATEPRGTVKVEVTGSHIVRSDLETALPVQTISREDIERSGSTTVAELMGKVSANLQSFNDARSVGNQLDPRPRPGLSSVNLRGIGDGSTLVLINGRRVANYAFDGGAVDVNSIPVSAIDRVEILKDGASAIYGTDAIAGVVNFILRKDFSGFSATAYGAVTQQGGGSQYQASVSAGYGDLARDRFNAWISLNWQKDEILRATDRPAQGGLDGPVTGNRWSLPANVYTPGYGLRNPAFDTGCAPPLSRPFQTGCVFNAASIADILPPVERTSVLGRVTLQAAADLQLFAEAGYAYNKFTLTLPPTPVDHLFTFNQEPVRYPAGGPYYPSAFAAQYDLSGDLELAYRTVPLGNRVNQVDTSALRVAVGADGAIRGWDYGSAVVYSRNQQTDDLSSGYVSQRLLLPALMTGLINPFGPSGADGDALLRGTQVYGDYHTATGSTLLLDAKASREWAKLPGGPLALAVGGEIRREELENSFTPLVQSGDVVTISQHDTTAATRSAQAAYAELSIPFAPGWESQVAVRYDHYSDFGGTTNPKVALRWQPAKSLLLRTSWGTGFRAPALYDLFTPLSQAFTSPFAQDPLRCPVTQRPEDCEGNFLAAIGGNPNLRPETSEQFNAGVVWEPIRGVALTVDYWRIDKSNTIAPLDESIVLGDIARWGPTNVFRGPPDPAFPQLPGPIESLLLWNENLGSLKTSGVDVGVDWRGPPTSIGTYSFKLNGTYVSTYSATLPGASEALSGVGNNFLGAVPRWRHYASLNWNYGRWSATLAQLFQSGYGEIDEDRCDDAGCPVRRVGSYSQWDVQAQYTGLRNTTFIAGVRNLLGADAPFTFRSPGFAALGDPTVADPRGRTFYVRLTYAFK